MSQREWGVPSPAGDVPGFLESLAQDSLLREAKLEARSCDFKRISRPGAGHRTVHHVVAAGSAGNGPPGRCMTWPFGCFFTARGQQEI